MDSLQPSMKELISHIEQAKKIAQSIGWEQTSYLIDIAWIDAVARAHNISEEELDLFFSVLENDAKVVKRTA